MKDGVSDAVVPWVGNSFVPTSNPFAKTPFESWAREQARGAGVGAGMGRCRLGVFSIGDLGRD